MQGASQWLKPTMRVLRADPSNTIARRGGSAWRCSGCCCDCDVGEVGGISGVSSREEDEQLSGGVWVCVGGEGDRRGDGAGDGFFTRERDLGTAGRSLGVL